MGDCSGKLINCDYCHTIPNNNIYIVTITHEGKYNGKNFCSLCYEQKVLEKHSFKLDDSILPIRNY